MKIEPIRYLTDLSIESCISRITAEPWEYGDELSPLWYRCDAVTENAMLVTFRGGKFRKIMQTRYLLSFTREPHGTIITLEFQSELLGMPPMSPIGDIDQFLEQKLRAIRVV